MQIPIIKGIYTDSEPSVRVAYPLNKIPVVEQSGVSNGYLRPADGIIQNGTSSGFCRGGINWNDELYRVTGSKLVKVSKSGAVVELGDVGGTNENVTMDYSFDRLAVTSNNNLFYYDDLNGFVQVTDEDLGPAIDVQWIDGYFITTDGENLVATDLDNPTSVNPDKFGSSEIDPDNIVGLLKLRNELYVLNRYTTEVFNTISDPEFFPLARKQGAQIQKGCVGTHACCIYQETVAFIGSKRGEQNSVYMGVNGNAGRISTDEIDDILEDYTEEQLSSVKLETRNDSASELLYVHLPDKTLVYNHEASQTLNSRVWCVLNTDTYYEARHFVYVYNEWQVGDPRSDKLGYFVQNISSHWTKKVDWEFSTQMIFNEGNGASFRELELIALTGSVALGETPRIRTSYSRDGQTWSQDKFREMGKIGNRAKRLVWRIQGFMQKIRIQRFQGDSDAHLSVLRLEAQLDPFTD